MATKNIKMKLSQDTLFQEKLNLSTHLATILSHPLRLSLLEFIDEFTVVDARKLDLVFKGDQTVLRTHLEMLISANFVKVSENGRLRFLTINYDQIERVNRLLDLFVTDPEKLGKFKSARQNKEGVKNQTQKLNKLKKSILLIKNKLRP